MAVYQERTWGRIAETRKPRGEKKTFEVGQIVALLLPNAVRGAADSKNLECCIVEVVMRGPTPSYRLRCNAGVLDTVHPGKSLARLPAASAARLTFGVEDAWQQVQTVKLAGAVAHLGRGTVIRCGCKQGCKEGSKCACRKAGGQCSRQCACKGITCCNFDRGE